MDDFRFQISNVGFLAQLPLSDYQSEYRLDADSVQPTIRI